MTTSAEDVHTQVFWLKFVIVNSGQKREAHQRDFR
jgi:hypothetical protein